MKIRIKKILSQMNITIHEIRNKILKSHSYANKSYYNPWPVNIPTLKRALAIGNSQNYITTQCLTLSHQKNLISVNDTILFYLYREL